VTEKKDIRLKNTDAGKRAAMISEEIGLKNKEVALYVN
jgi:hypothetical protein